MPLGDGVLDYSAIIMGAGGIIPRLRSLISIDDVPTIEAIDKLDDAFMYEGPLPGIFPQHGRSAAERQNGGSLKLRPAARNKISTVKLAIAVVAESYASDHTAARAGAWQLVALTKDALDGFRHPRFQNAFDYVDDHFVLRTPDNTRVIYEVVFEAKAEEFTTPAATPAP